jgi:hypothetical protein
MPERPQINAFTPKNERVYDHICILFGMDPDQELQVELNRLGSIALDLDVPQDARMEQLRSLLLGRIIWLLHYDLERLWNILYRVDVHEAKVKALFHLPDPKQIAPGIAELVIERLMQKIKSRKDLS